MRSHLQGYDSTASFWKNACFAESIGDLVFKTLRMMGVRDTVFPFIGVRCCQYGWATGLRLRLRSIQMPLPTQPSVLPSLVPVPFLCAFWHVDAENEDEDGRGTKTTGATRYR